MRVNDEQIQIVKMRSHNITSLMCCEFMRETD